MTEQPPAECEDAGRLAAAGDGNDPARARPAYAAARGRLLEPAHRTLRAGWRSLVALIYPPVCVACRAATGEAQALCPHCWGEIAFIERPYCERLGTPFAVDLGPGLISPAAIANPPVFARARAVCRFDGVARELVHKLKYGDRTELALTLGRMMLQAGRDLVADADLAVPVPLHRTRLWSRRFNQAALLAAIVAEKSGLPLRPNLLVRAKRTRRQVGLSRVQRADNLQGAFRVPEEARPQLEGRHVLLVDDVLTTGATANAAARALLRGGARQVDLLSFARVVTDG
ncbi:MAG: ComF family protein [Bosea sp.]|uniref:ComF family protein n=1 Tax=unclassified Bosea (in: a-proteobacteria) TaxID=2653178 RepID=UPI000ACE5FA9|nr:MULTISPECIES: ComF family protein [unclassified Bosea (in: a-proteobacteria)]MBN9455368.1 ComF family protein [Bosea sp. (in: a-proteobacteria)]